MSEKNETPRQRAKREGRAYVKIVIDSRYSEKGGALIEYDGPHTPKKLELARKFLLEMIK